MIELNLVLPPLERQLRTAFECDQRFHQISTCSALLQLTAWLMSRHIEDSVQPESTRWKESTLNKAMTVPCSEPPLICFPLVRDETLCVTDCSNSM